MLRTTIITVKVMNLSKPIMAPTIMERLAKLRYSNY